MGATELMWAVFNPYPQIETIEELIKNGASPEAKDNKGYGALDRAMARWGDPFRSPNPEVIKILKQAIDRGN